MGAGRRQAARAVAAARRILVLGSSGSGKSTFTKRLCALLDLEAIHLDALFWQPGWKPSDQQEWRRRLAPLVRRESWVMDGTYESTLDLRLAAAESVIYLEVGRALCLWRALRRMARPSHGPPESPLGYRFDPGLLRYIWRFPRVTRPRVLGILRDQGREGDLVLLRGGRESERFLDRVREQRR